MTTWKKAILSVIGLAVVGIMLHFKLYEESKALFYVILVCIVGLGAFIWST